MGLEKIQNWSIRYYLLKTYARFWHNTFFYSRVTVIGKHNIPKNNHLIYTANHQNALMDAMALVTDLTSQPIFLARSDLFTKPFLASMMYVFKILPVYRIRDGFETLKKNDAVFDKTVEVINNGRGLGILPEGNHSPFRRLRPLKKGFARIAFQTEEASDYRLNIQIIPVGIDYTNHASYRSSLLINYGPPLNVSDYYDYYKKEPVKAINKLRDDLGERIKPLMVHISSEEFYTLYDELREIYKHQMAKQLSLKKCRHPYKLQADQELIKRLEKKESNHIEEFKVLQEHIENLKKFIQKHQFSYDLFYKGNRSPFSLILSDLLLISTFPIFILGFLFNILPYWIPIRVSKIFKDAQFHSSVKFVIAPAVFPIYYLILALLSRIFLSWMWAGIFLLSLPVAGILAYIWVQLYKNRKAHWGYFLLKFRKNKAFLEMRKTYENILSTTDSLVS